MTTEFTENVEIKSREEKMNEYFDCIVECDLLDKECTTTCLTLLKEQDE